MKSVLEVHTAIFWILALSSLVGTTLKMQYILRKIGIHIQDYTKTKLKRIFSTARISNSMQHTGFSPMRDYHLHRCDAV
jgi:hypothetical protein